MAEPLRNDSLSETRFPEPTPPLEVPRATPVNVLAGGYARSEDVRSDIKEPWERRIDELGVEAVQLTEQVLQAIDGAVDRARQTADDLKQGFDTIRSRVESGELQEEARERAAYIARQTVRRVEETRRWVQVYSRNEPLKFVAGVAIAGFAVGFLLRMWGDE